MTKDEIVAGLLDNAEDRRAMVSKDEPDSIFAHDALVMEEAASLINRLWNENLRLRTRSFPARLWHPYMGKRLKGNK